jgi:tetratricopeptide (TPR) repeat protein
MTALQERIAQYRKMANDDPDNELGHFNLGKLLLEAGQYAEAAQSFRKTLELSPQFSKAFQLLGTCLVQAGQHEEAVRVLQEGYEVASRRGENIPREEMARLLAQLGQPVPEAAKAAAPRAAAGGEGFHCQRPGCQSGPWARQLPAPPMEDELGRRIQASVCADCWMDWLRNYSVKVINEMRLDLSTERGQEMYDQIMKEFLGLE